MVILALGLETYKSKLVKVMWICIAPCHEHTSKVWHTFSGDPTVLPVHPPFIHNEPYLPFRSQPKLILIYRPWRDGRLSWPGWLEINVQHLEVNPDTVTHPVPTGPGVD